jgi:hypothetical protein
MDIGKDDWVECISDEDPGTSFFTNETDAPYIEVGKVYRVWGIIDGSYYEDGLAALQLHEFPEEDASGIRFGFCIDLFKPIYREKDMFLEQLLAPTPAAYEEPKRIVKETVS